jgi:hypothetical protein
MSVILQLKSTNGPIKAPWTNQQVRILEKLYQKGLSPQKIGKRMGRTPDGVQKALLRFEIRKKRSIVRARGIPCKACHGKGYLAANGNGA